MNLPISDTMVELVRFVFPRHANIRGSLYGGQMMYWMVESGMLTASRIARGPVVLASMESLDFIEPVGIGDYLTFRAYVEYVGNSSIEVAVFTEVRPMKSKETEGKLATSAYFTFVAVDDQGKPCPADRKVAPKDPYEVAIYNNAVQRRQDRSLRLNRPAHEVQNINLHKNLRYGLDFVRLVLPDDTLISRTLFAGKLLFELDQAASILSLRFARGGVVTASVDAMDFYAPIFVGNALHIKVAINHVSRSSMEIGAKILGEDITRGEFCHCASAYLTFVHLDEEGKAAPLPTVYKPESEEEKEHWEEALERKKIRLSRREARSKDVSR